MALDRCQHLSSLTSRQALVEVSAAVPENRKKLILAEWVTTRNQVVVLLHLALLGSPKAVDRSKASRRKVQVALEPNRLPNIPALDRLVNKHLAASVSPRSLNRRLEGSARPSPNLHSKNRLNRLASLVLP